MQLARALRRQGYSLSELSSCLGISKSTASVWTKDVLMSESGMVRIARSKDIHRKIGYEVLKAKRMARIANAEAEAKSMAAALRRDDHASRLAALATMYWCEGVKSDQSVSFTNSDPDLVCSFIRLLETSFDIDKKRLRICVHMHDYHDKNETSAFWSRVTGVPLSQFTKPFMKQSRHSFQKFGYKGCARVSYHDSRIARVLLSVAKRVIKLYI